MSIQCPFFNSLWFVEFVKDINSGYFYSNPKNQDSRVLGYKIPTSQMQLQSIFQGTNEGMYSDVTLNHVCAIFYS
jgi:hypothetical protein